nr:uncharacterized protein LOC128703183 [Cherax quadricarinatus]
MKKFLVGTCYQKEKGFFSPRSSGHLSDVTLVFSDNRRIQAHKLILATSSPVFKVMTYGAMATNKITLACDSYEMFQLLLCYIYKEEINLTEVHQVDTLGLYCSKYLMVEVTLATLPLVYDWTLLLRTSYCCISTQVLVMAADNVLESSEIIFMRRSSLWQLLTNPRLCMSSEIIIIKAITAWGVENAGYHPHPAETSLVLTPLENARQNRSSNSCHAGQCGSVVHNGVEHLDSFKPATSELKKTVEEFLPIVRFDEMSVEELVTWVFPSGIFTGDECEALVMNVKGIHTSALPASVSHMENIGRKRMPRSTMLLSLNSTNGSSSEYIYYNKVNMNLLQNILNNKFEFSILHMHQVDTLGLYCSKYFMVKGTLATLPLVYDWTLLLRTSYCCISTQVLVMSADNVLESSEIIFMRRSSLWQLLTNPRLCMSSEIIIIKAITAWGVENAGYHRHPAETSLVLTPQENARQNRSSNSCWNHSSNLEIVT